MEFYGILCDYLFNYVSTHPSIDDDVCAYLSLHTYVSICIHTYVHINILYVYTHIYIYIIYVCIDVCVYIYIYVATELYRYSVILSIYK